MHDPFDLGRFIDAQAGVYPRVVEELRAGRKTSHWMWFVFPQIEGLGHSPAARRYALRSREEASAYLDHDVLGARLRQCTELATQAQGRSAAALFGSPDDMKFRSSMTLFAAVAPREPLFPAALAKYFGGAADRLTLDRIGP